MNDLSANIETPPEDTQEVTIAPPAATPVPFNADECIGQYVKLRDLASERKEAHKKELEPITEAMAALEEAMLAQLNSIGADNLTSKSGTVYKTKKESASVADMEAFWAYVVATGSWHLLDKKANVTGCREYIDNKVDQGNAPPGVNFSSMNKVNVRRK